MTETAAAVARAGGASAAYDALASRDARFDGRLWYGVTSTGIYCRPVCPARTPRRENVRVFGSAAAAVAAGFRACRRCRPDVQPGTRDWDHRGDLAARALRLVAAGAVDEDGVAGVARRLNVSERHLHRTLVAEVGAGPLQLALSRRAQTARLLLDETDLSVTEVAFAAGFASLRQCNDVMKREFGVPPSALRRRVADEAAAGRRPVDDGASVVLRLRRRLPYDGDALLGHLAARAVTGLDRVDLDARTVARAVALPTRPARLEVSLRVDGDHVVVRVTGAAVPDLGPLVRHVRRWLDLDADPRAVADVLAADPRLAGLVAARPGLRVPTTLDPFEGVVRAVVGQRVAVATARTLLGRVVAAFGEAAPEGGRLFPTAAVLASAGPEATGPLGLTRARAATVHAVALAVAEGRLDLDPAGDREAAVAGLAAIPGIGPWTVAYVSLRALADPDAFPATDLGLLRTWRALGHDPATLAAAAPRWAPWRSYAAQHLWTADPASRPRKDLLP